MLYFDQAMEFLLSWPLRLFKLIDPMALHFWVAAFAITIAIFVFKFGKTWKRSLRNKLSEPTFLRELVFDLKSYGFKIIYETAFFAFIGFNVNHISRKLYHLFHSQFLSQNYSQPLILEGETGLVLVSLFYLLALDFGNFLGHFFSHKFDSLWLFHRFHHSAESLNPLTKYRAHPITMIFMMLVTAVSLIVAMSAFQIFIYIPEHPGHYHLTTLFFGYFLTMHLRHSFVRLSFGPVLSYIFVSPFMHQVHHSRLEQHQFKNFGVMFAIWDLMFGTHYIPHQNEKLLIGEKLHYKKSQSVVRELIRPFQELFSGFKKIDLKSQKGTTLTEMVIAMAVMAVLAVGGMTLFADVLFLDKKIKANINVDRDFDAAAYHLEKFAMFAQNVRFAGNANLAGTASSLDEGYIRRFEYDSFGDLPGAGTITPLMYFPYETRTSATGNITSEYRAAAVFFREPTETVSGALLFYYHSATGAFTIDPNQAFLNLEGIVGLRIENVQRSPNDVVMSADVVIVARRFSENALATHIRWCPANSYTAGCAGGSSYRDFERRVSLNFTNNLRDTDRRTFEFSNGAYIFPSRGL